MALVQYSDSESDTDDPQAPVSPPPRPVKRLRQEPSSTSLPPLPTAFHDLYASSTRVSVRDDPSLHGGRQRVIPHVEGNWPTHIYLEWYPSKGELGILENIISQCGDQLGENKTHMHSLLHSDLGVQLPLHISLSRPVVLQTEQRSSFIETLENALRNSYIQPFNVKLDNLDWVSNYEKTRWFLVLRVKRPENDNLNDLLKLSNRSLVLFGQPPLYETSLVANKKSRGAVQRLQSQPDDQADTEDDYSHCFHISLAWSLMEPSLEEKKRVANVDLRELRDLSVHFNSVKAKIGNNVSSIPLSTETLEERGFGGL